MLMREGQCVGILEGLVIGLSLTVCIPAGATEDQIFRVIMKYIDQRPERMHERFSQLAREALLAAWPCRPMEEKP